MTQLAIQVEDPKEAKGLVKREVVGIVTPGTASQPGLLESKEENLLACLIWNDRKGAGAFLDLSTGGFYVRRWESIDECLEDLGVLKPREVLLEPGKIPDEIEGWVHREVLCRTMLEDDLLVDRRHAADLLRQQFGTQTLRGFGLDDKEPAVFAAASALAYAQTTQHSDLSHIRALKVRGTRDHLVLDAAAITAGSLSSRP